MNRSICGASVVFTLGLFSCAPGGGVEIVGTGGAGAGGTPVVGSGGSGGSVPGSGGSATGTGGAGTPASGGATGTGGSGGGVPATGGAVGSGGNVGSGGRGGQTGTGGAAGRGGQTGTGGRGGQTGTGGSIATGGSTPGGTGGAGTTSNFSFFVTSLEAMRMLSGNVNGFGGDLRFGEATGLAGADKICRETAKLGMPGAETKTWRAFLSTFGPPAVNAIDRVGTGPWYDRMGRVVSMTKAGLAMTRPQGANTAIINDLPNETGLPNQQGVDNHDTLTGSTAAGVLQASNAAGTCNDWTSAVGATGRPMLGHSWPAQSGMSWIQAHQAAGCAPSVNLTQSGGAPPGANGVGSGGGYGGIYCFALP